MIIGLAGVALTAFLGGAHFGHHGLHAKSIPHGHGTAIGSGGGAHSPALHGHGHGLLGRLSGRGLRSSHHGPSAKADSPTASGAMPVTTHHHFNPLALLPSPVDLFSICFGVGAVGFLATGRIDPRMLAPVALIGGLLFDLLAVRPFFALMLRFASKPSEGLEGTVALQAEAITKFDERGQGLVCVNMEGQLVQILARLSPDDLAGGVTVHKGDQVIVTEVDKERNMCQVTRQLSL